MGKWSKGFKEHKKVLVVIDKKGWEMENKGAQALIELGRQKYEKLGTPAIVAVKRGEIYSLLNDTYPNKEAMQKAINDWVKGGYIPYHTEI
jgi:hypothetical protein